MSGAADRVPCSGGKDVRVGEGAEYRMSNLKSAGHALRVVFFVFASTATASSSYAQQGTPGTTQRVVFPPFDPRAPACGKPPGLARVLGYVQENERDFLQGVS